MNIAKNKSYKQYNHINRYSLFPTYYNELDDKYFGGITGHLSDRTNYVTHIVNKGDTLDSLALFYYGNSTRFWIIADYNRILDPFLPLKESTKIKIPTFTDIMFEEVE